MGNGADTAHVSVPIANVLSFTAKSAVGACDDLLKDGLDHKTVCKLQIARASGRFRSTQRSRRHHLLLDADLWAWGLLLVGHCAPGAICLYSTLPTDG